MLDWFTPEEQEMWDALEHGGWLAYMSERMLAIYLYIARHQDRAATKGLPQGTIADAYGISTSCVSRTLRKLKEDSLVTVVRRTGQQANLLAIRIPLHPAPEGKQSRKG
ncbi:MAG TPA: hypothetical protein VGN26_12610 [Armatimonadota bacterium]|jgi:DNA-binding MarR family transcriptional regulator